MERSLRRRIREVKLTGGCGSSSRWHVGASPKIEEVRRAGGSLFWGESEGHWSSSDVEPRERFDAAEFKVLRHDGFFRRRILTPVE